MVQQIKNGFGRWAFFTGPGYIRNACAYSMGQHPAPAEESGVYATWSPFTTSEGRR